MASLGLSHPLPDKLVCALCQVELEFALNLMAQAVGAQVIAQAAGPGVQERADGRSQ